MITPQMNKLLDYLSTEEGLNFHKNTNELDITSPYGIYKHEHPRAKIFTYLLKMVISLDVPRHTEDWTKDDINKVNTFLNMSPIVKLEIRKLAAEFYEEYYKAAHLELFPEEAVIAMVSMFTTSTRNATKAVQHAINECIDNEFISHETLVVDGGFGNKTKTAMREILKLRIINGEFFGFMFEEKLIRHMTMIYDNLAYENKSRYGKFRNGWRNRMNRLAENRG